MGGFVALVIAVGAFAVVALAPVERPSRLLGLWLGGLLLYGVVRLVVIGAARPELPMQGLETSPWFSLASWLPWTLIAPRVSLRTAQAAAADTWGRPIAGFALGVLWTMALAWD